MNNITIPPDNFHPLTGDFGIYTIHRNIILGTGISTVYLGSTGTEHVAIKKINVSNLSTHHTKLLTNELTVLKHIMIHPHPNIIKIHDIIDEIDTIYIIMEHCTDGDLTSLITGNKSIKLKYAKHYFHQLLQAIYHLHIHKIIHRDLKPKNILLTNNKTQLKLCDFGFAKIASGLKKSSTMCGTPLYMAPEIYKHSGYNIESDIWSLGIIFYEMLHGHTPFSSCTNYRELSGAITNYLIDQNLDVNHSNIDIPTKQLLTQLLDTNDDTRISLHDLYIHPYFHDTIPIIPDDADLIYESRNSLYKNPRPESDGCLFKLSI